MVKRNSSIRPLDPDGANSKGLDMDFIDSEIEYLESRNFVVRDMPSDENKWQMLQNIRSMPTSIAVKRFIKDRLNSGKAAKLSTIESFKRNTKKKWTNFKKSYREVTVYLELWGQPMRRIEGKHGSAVLSYFVFLKWLLYLNIFMFVVIFVFTTLPQCIFPAIQYSQYVTGYVNASTATALAQQCSATYTVAISSDAGQLVLDILQGTGWMEKTVMFYGAYADTEVKFSSTTFHYNLPLAYLLVVCLCLLVCLAIMAHRMASTYRKSLANSDSKSTLWTNSVLCAWDHSLYVSSTVEAKKISIYNELYANLDEDDQEKVRRNMTSGQKCALYSVRIAINLFIVACLGAGAYLIYWVTNFSTNEIMTSDFRTKYHQVVQLLIEYLPSITISLLTGLLPPLFKYLVRFEKYRPEYCTNITLIRTVFLKLASLSMLVFTLYVQITCTPKDACHVGVADCSNLQCWETYVGQQFYKLIMMDFVVMVVMILGVELTRKLLVRFCRCRLTEIVGYQQFDITKNVLDLVYSQTLCWVGFLFAPLVTPMCVIKLIFVFYLKQLSAMFLCIPAENPYKASKTNSFFVMVLCVAFFLACVPVGWTISEMTPSRGCGPYRIHDHMYGIFTVTISNWPTVLRVIWEILTSSAVIVAILILLSLALYYCSVINRSNKDMVRLLQQQLIIEARDKQFLIQQSGLDRPPSARKPAKASSPAMNTDQETLPPIYLDKGGKSNTAVPETYPQQNVVLEQPYVPNVHAQFQ